MFKKLTLLFSFISLMFLIGCGNQTIGPTVLSTSLVFDKNPAWSPNSDYIFFERRYETSGIYGSTLQDGSGLYVYNLETGETKYLIHNGHIEDNIQIDFHSSNEKFVAATYLDLYIFDFAFDTLKVTNSTKTEFQEGYWVGYPKWSPNEEWIAFERNYGVNDSQIWLMKSDSTDTRFAFLGATPEWHPTEEYIIAASFNEGDSEGTTLLKVDPFNPANRDTLDINPGAFNIFPSFSPDGTQLVFQSETDSSAVVMVSNSDGTDMRVLADGGQPVWSPDGTMIVFLQFDENDEVQMWLMDSDGTNKRKLIQ